MKAARLHSYEDVEKGTLPIEEVAEPRITGPLDVIVRIGGAGLCRTDLHICEGIWKGDLDSEGTRLPYILGHENAGWVQEVGQGVTSVKPGDAVICHPFLTCGLCRNCRRGEDMYCSVGAFPGLDSDGGFADYLLTSVRCLVPLRGTTQPADVAPLADAGLTAYRAVRRARRRLPPGSNCVVLGVGGLGHIAIQVLLASTPATIIAVDLNEPARALATELGAHYVLDGGVDVADEIKELTEGGCDVVIDLVGEGGAEQQAWRMLRDGGVHYVVGYGGLLQVPTMHLVSHEIAVVGSKVGNYRELIELMELHASGLVRLISTTYSLNHINQAIDDFRAGRVLGRAVIVP